MPHHTASATALRTEGGSRHALDISALGEADQHRFILDQVGFAQFFLGIRRDARTAVIAIFFSQIAHIILNERQDLLRVGQQIFKMSDLLCDLFVLFFDLPAFQGGQPAQLHIQNGLRLDFAQFEAL